MTQMPSITQISLQWNILLYPNLLRPEGQFLSNDSRTIYDAIVKIYQSVSVCVLIATSSAPGPPCAPRIGPILAKNIRLAELAVLMWSATS